MILTDWIGFRAPWAVEMEYLGPWRGVREDGLASRAGMLLDRVTQPTGDGLTLPGAIFKRRAIRM